MFEKKPPLFERGGKPSISVTIRRVSDWIDDGWGIIASAFVPGEIEGGHELTISGVANDYWKAERPVTGPAPRVHIKIQSDLSRRQMDRGIIGGGQVFEDYLDIVLNLEPDQVRDVLHEMRLSHARQVHVSGYAISDKIFRVTQFGFSEPRDHEP